MDTYEANPPRVGDRQIVVLHASEWPVVQCTAVYPDGSWDGRLPDILQCTAEHGFAAGEVVRFEHYELEKNFGWAAMPPGDAL